MNTYLDRWQRLKDQLEPELQAALIRLDELIAIENAFRDAARIDWLADVENVIGAVHLPVECVTENPICMRAAIDAAMRLDAQERPQ